MDNQPPSAPTQQLNLTKARAREPEPNFAEPKSFTSSFPQTTTQRAAAVFESSNLKLLPATNKLKADSKDMWNEIAQYHKAQQEIETHHKKMQKKGQIKTWQSQLQSQIQAGEDEKRRAAEENRNYARQKAEELARWKQQEAKKKADQRKANLDQKRMQDAQRREQAAQKQKEADNKRADDLRLVEMLQKQMQDDIEKDRQRKVAEKKKMERVQVENKANLALKARKREQEQQYEMKLAGDYVEMENAKEAAREAQLKAMADRIEAKMSMGANVIAEVDNRERLNEERAKKEQERYNKQREREEARRRKAAKERTDTQLKVLKTQVVERQQKLEKEEREMKEQAKIWKTQVEEYDVTERKKERDTRERNMSQQKWLERQIIEKSASVLRADQSALEMQMNRSIMTKIGGMKQQLRQSDSGMSIGAKTRARSAEIEAQQMQLSNSRDSSVLQKMDARTTKY